MTAAIPASAVDTWSGDGPAWHAASLSISTAWANGVHPWPRWRFTSAPAAIRRRAISTSICSMAKCNGGWRWPSSALTSTPARIATSTPDRSPAQTASESEARSAIEVCSSARPELHDIDEGRPGRDDGGYHTSQTPRAEPAPDDIFSPDARPVPAVLLARRRPRPPLRPQARPAVPRGRPRSGAADRHHLDQGRQAQRPVPPLLHRRRRRRQAGRSHRPTPADRGGPAAAQGGHATDPRPGRYPDPAVRAARPGGRRASQPDPRPGRLALRLWPRLRPWVARHS